MNRQASAPGKIILSGEYAVVFGYAGIAVPATMRIAVTLEEDVAPSIEWPDVSKEWLNYLQTIINHCKDLGAETSGKMTVQNGVPLRKGMGSSTALVVAVARCFFGDDCREQALKIEDCVNPGHSGTDFNVIWEDAPILFRKNEGYELIALPSDLLKEACLIDTGTPNETTPELVAWVREREDELRPHLQTIGNCTERLEKLGTRMSSRAPSRDEARQTFIKIIHDHHQAQVALGVVPQEVQKLIREIEESGGAAKVLGAGARTGGGGMVLALGIDEDFLSKQEFTYSSLAL